MIVDDVPLPEDEARALWTRFSAHMDAHQGDMAGFAKENGWVSAAPEYRKGQAVLVVKTATTPANKTRTASPPKAATRKVRRRR